MGFVDKKIDLLNSVALPTSGLSPVCGDIIDLGPGTRNTGFDDLYLVVSCTETFADDASGVPPRVVIGVSTMDSTPTGVVATDAAALFGSTSRVFQYGNVDLGAGLAIFGLASLTIGQHILVGKLTRIAAVQTGRYMGCWLALAALTAAETGTLSAPTAGKLTAFLTTVPPTSKFTWPNGF